MSEVEQLEEIETKLRSRENDFLYLKGQLLILSACVDRFIRGDIEEGLISGALGGIDYVVGRLRKLINPQDTVIKSREELMSLYAKVELTRYARTETEIQNSLTFFRKENLLFNTHSVLLEDTTKVVAFSSAKDQTTIDGRKIKQGELLDAASAAVPSFSEVYRQLPEVEKVFK